MAYMFKKMRCIIITQNAQGEKYMISITDEILQKYQDRLNSRAVLDAQNQTYVDGVNFTILHKPAVIDPDNRVPIPLAATAVTDIIGYAGGPEAIDTEYVLAEAREIDGEEITTDDITEILAEIDEHNLEGIENSELMTQSLSVGLAYELWWVSNKLDLESGIMTPEYKILPNAECWPVYDSGIKPELEAFIRFWADDDDNQYADVYYPKRSERWTNKKDDAGYKRDSAGDTTYPYNRVPVIVYRTSMKDLPVFNAQKRIIDSFDTLVSKTQNEVDRYNALITLFPGSVDAGFIKELAELAKPYIQGLEEYDPASWPRYLEKNLSGIQGFYDSQANRLERLFHKTINIPDMSDEQFAGSQSGVAIAYKLIGFEFLISVIEVYFRQGLKARKDMFFDVIETGTNAVKREDYDQIIKWRRNIPVDDEGKVRIAAMLMGLGVSQEMIMKFLPVTMIGDVKAELERQEAEKEAEPDITLIPGKDEDE